MTATARDQVFSAVHTVGGLIPADMLVRISEGKDVSGSRPADYQVMGSRSVRDEAERRWDYLKSVWKELRTRLPGAKEAETPADPTGLAISQWLEPLFAELTFGSLTPLGASGIPADDGDKVFPISHRWNHVPIHLTPWNVTLDKRSGVPGAVPPQSLVQECLNRTEAHLWGVLTNGRQLRLLRDSTSLATAAYVEFDLEAIFDGELFSEFVLLYRLLHVSRFRIDDGAPPSSCRLEQWRLEAIESGTRALDHHRKGVEKAINALGTGFLSHPANAERFRDLDAEAFHAALLRLAYRLIFLFVAEDRDVLHPRDVPSQTKERYERYFSSARMRRHALRHRGTEHGDLFQALLIVLNALGDEEGRPELGIPGLGGLFEDTDSDAPLRGAALSNSSLLEAIRCLARVWDESTRRWRRVDYRNMGSEELGSIYESLLELKPERTPNGTFELVNVQGNNRKKTGSYYTPASLIETLLNSTLDPVIDDAQKRGEEKAANAGVADPSEAIVAELLALTVCDPACGSGHFLVAAARRIAKRVAAVREGNPEPTVDAVRHALHEVIEHCVYGVDLNPLAVELAKVSLWLEALEPGKPLGFLDAHIKLGNGLIGATPVLLRDGIPTKAFNYVEGDDESYGKFLGKQNDKERGGQGGLFDLTLETKVDNTAFASGLRRITAAPADTLRDVRRQAAAYRAWRNDAEYVRARHIADAWCAAFMWHKTKDAPPAITHDVFMALQDPDSTAVSQETHDEIRRLTEEYHFFHWHLEFPEIFTVPDDISNEDVDPRTGWAGGFSCVLGNPPWDKVDFEDKKYFSVVDPSIAALSGVRRRQRIDEWIEEDPDAGRRYLAARRKVKSTFHFTSKSGAFPLCQEGLSVKGVNSLFLEHLFPERFADIAASRGRFGCIVPTTIATGAGAQCLFRHFSQGGAITSLFDFDNRKPLFEGVDSRQKFCLLSLVGRGLREPSAHLAFFLQDTPDLESTENVFALSPEEISLINPNTGTLPIFRSRRDADLTIKVYRNIPVLWNEGDHNGNRWGIRFKNLFNSTDDSDLFWTEATLEAAGWRRTGSIYTRDNESALPVFEGKMAHLFDHRWNQYYGLGDNDYEAVPLQTKTNPHGTSKPRRWIQKDGFVSTTRKNKPVKVPGISLRLQEDGWNNEWLCGWRDIARTTDERTAIPAFVPLAAAVETFPLMLPQVSPALVCSLVAAQSSLVFDFIARQKASGAHMGRRIWKQLPVPRPEDLATHTTFLVRRVLELVYTAHEMAHLARDLGDASEPFCWDEERRAQIRAELDAYFFLLYGITQDDADYILETFQTDTGGLKNNEIAKYGTYRTKDLVLAEYNRMAPLGVNLETALVDGENYTSTLTPPPGHGPRHG
ncbi:Eco57I restriction-modification methylase domain-containing protein [Thermomonospora umbrina]|uniref:site-specific DNA-methyltransferase (adenine-specific) n=1 Tax=Thermomonospora umbrina TaxID=111806 RepID=A0A3D9SQI1_9ACTN|nr:DNA methyltransferase [Thermomonospora umbrina]REE98222.1 N-6 DNA methylase [Thermomonospora umbrina]